MPLTLNVGVSKKVGLPDFGSVGATCNVTVELDANLLQSDLDTFHSRVRGAYVACAQAVSDELARQQGQPGSNGNGKSTPAASSAPTHHGNGNGNGHHPSANGNGQNGSGHTPNGRGNGQNGNGQTGGRLATASQVRAICGIAKRQKIDLSAALQDRFGVSRPDDLSIGQASEFIDAIKPQPSSAGGRQ
jgi:hypothetical protein